MVYIADPFHWTIVQEYVRTPMINYRSAATEGQSLEKISSQFLACGLPSPYNNLRRGKQALSKILSYERYLGNEDYPKIIEPDLFDRVMAVPQSRQK